MKVFKFCKRNLAVIMAVIIGSAGALWTGITWDHVQETQMEIAKQVIRFHVLANSDRTADQEIKLQVKDRLLKEMGVLLEGADTLDETRKSLQENLPLLQEKAEETVRLAGSRQAVTVRLTTADFPVKTYGDYTFPAGRYETLQVELGNAKGHNWWCMIYPSLCFEDALHPAMTEKGGKKLKGVLSDEAYDSILQKGELSIGFLWF